MLRVFEKLGFSLLLVFISSTTAFAAPGITDLSSGTPTVNGIPLSWSVVSGGPATAYELRYSTAPLDAGNFPSAVPLGGVPAPTGGTENYTVSGLACGTKYWFGVMGYDAAKSGGLSNIVSAVTAACTPAFSSAAAVSGASSLYAFAKGDFNNDGRQDLAFTVGTGGTGNIVFYPGNGVGGFGSPVISTGVTGNYPLLPSAGDFNRDGKLDLAVPNFSSDSVSILLGDGAGGFTGSGTISTGDEPQDIAVNDFDRDGNPDIAVALWGGHAVAVYLGDGSGDFELEGSYGGYDGNARLNFIRAADLDGDGILDIVVADPGISPYRSNIGVLLGNGDGSFQDRVEYTVGNLPGNISIGDLNRDGNPDIIATSYSENLLAVFTGVGDGTFSDPTTYAIGGNALFSDIADFNGDGIPDIALGMASGNLLLLLTGKGDGSFNNPLSFPVGGNIRQAVSDDFDGDGKPDAVALASDQATIFSVMNTTAWGPSGNFIPPANYSSGYHPNYVTTGDINGDGIQDVVTTSQFTRNFFSVWLGNGDGSLGPEVQHGGVLEPHMPLIADFNNDGKPDLAIAELEGDRVSIRLGNGDGTFQAPLNGATVGDGPVSLVSGDFNGDGKLDLGVGHWYSNWFAFLLGNGDGTFQPAVLHDIGAKSFHPVAADFNCDGKLDIVTGNYELNSLSMFTGVGDGTFTHSRIDLPGNGVPYLDDFNKDGKPDLAVSSSANGGSTLVLLGNGNGTFQSPLINAVGRGNMAVGDLDRDGKPDIVIGDYTNNSASLLRGNGDGTFAEPVRFATATGTGDIALADFNRDGLPDIITSNVDSDSISILLNAAPLPTVPQQGLVALWRAENNALDSIGGNHGSLHNGATYAAGRYGQAFSLDGEDDYVEIPNSPSLNPAAAITVEAWYRPVSFAGNGNNAIVSKGYSSHSAPHYEYHLGVNGDQYSSTNSRPGSFSFSVSPNNIRVYVETAANLWVPGNWYHLVGTYDGTEIRLYVNGVLQSSAPATGTLNDYGMSVRIGAFNNISSSIDYTPGLIDEVAIYNRALAATEIAAISAMAPNPFSFTPQTGMPVNTAIQSNPITVTGIYYPATISITGGDYALSSDGGASWGGWTNAAVTVSLNNQVKVRQTSSASNATTTTATLTIGGVSGDFSVTTATAGDPNATGLVSWWKGEGNANDSVGGNHGTAINGATYAAGQIGQAFSFDGLDDNISIANNASMDFGTGDFSIDLWVMLNSLSGEQIFIQKYVGNPPENSKGYLMQFVPPNSLRLLVMDTIFNKNDIIVGVPSLTAGRWYHVTGVRSGNNAKLYLDGALIADQTAGNNVDTGTGGTAKLGAMVPIVPGDTRYLNGYLDQVEIYNRALSSSEVSQLAGTYPDAFSFTSKTSSTLNSLTESDAITVTGITQPAQISITIGEYSVSSDNGVNWSTYSSSSPTTVSVNDRVKVNLISPSSFGTTTTATLNIGGREGTFTVTTVDTEKPVVGSFTITPTDSTNMGVNVSLSASDDSGIISGYMIKTSSTPPLATDPGWSGTKPTTLTLTTAGGNTLYAWAKDPAGNVSSPSASSVATVTLKPVLREPSIYYTSLQTACGEAISGETVKALAVTVPESVTIAGKALTIKGGHADGYGSQSGVTVIQGKLEVGTGTLIVDRVAVR